MRIKRRRFRPLLRKFVEGFVVVVVVDVAPFEDPPSNSRAVIDDDDDEVVPLWLFMLPLWDSPPPLPSSLFRRRGIMISDLFDAF